MKTVRGVVVGVNVGVGVVVVKLSTKARNRLQPCTRSRTPKRDDVVVVVVVVVFVTQSSETRPLRCAAAPAR